MSELDEAPAIRAGLDAWRRGDLDAIERVLDPAVTLKAIRSGPWDCENRDQVMTLLRQRAEQRQHAATPEVEVLRLDESTYLVSGLGGGSATATLVNLNAGRVVSMQQISTEACDPNAGAAVAAIHSGDLDTLAGLLDAAPELTTGPVPGYQGRTLLHVVTDWPGYWPHGPEIVAVLIEHSADPNHRGADGHGETPLHWAASSDDAHVAEALINGGADIEAPDGSIGTPLDNAIGYGCWNVARLLAARGASIDKLWHAAALGKLNRLEELLAANPDHDQISQAFWHACAAGQRRAAQRLLDAGADLNWTPDHADGTPLDAARGQSTQSQNLIQWLEAIGATPPSPERSER